MRRAIVVGALGQDGRLLSEQLLECGCDVLGVVREAPPVRGRHCEGPVAVCADSGSTAPSRSRLGSDSRRRGSMALCAIELRDPTAVAQAVRRHAPDEVYYLAAHHHSSEGAELRSSAELWERSVAVHVTGLIHFLEALREHSPGAGFFYAASSLIFGRPDRSPQNEDTPRRPCCVYGVTKSAGLDVCRFFREQHGLRASVGILYNHESHLRPSGFLSSRILDGAIRIHRGEQRELVLGDLSAQTDWGYAPDYVEAMQRIVALDDAGEFVVASGVLHRVRDWVETAFGLLGLSWRDHVREDPTLVLRRKEPLVGDARRLRERTGWTPTTSFEDMVREILRHKRALN